MNIEDRQQLLEEAIELVSFSDIHLGDKIPEKEADPLKKKAVALLEDLKKEQVEFSPKLSVYPLTQEDYPTDAKPLLTDIKKKMREHNLYKVDIPITLKSAPDWAFSSLVCNVAFCRDEEDSKQVHLLPIIHDIFPSDEWQEILSFQESLTLGLDENLAFRAEVEKMEGKWQQLGGEAQAKLAVQVGGGIKLAFGPFFYRIRQAKIRSRGRGNVQAFWELQGTKYVNEQDLMLGVILMVPKSRSKPISVIGALEAHHDFQVWSANLLPFNRFFQGAIQQFLEGGAAIQKTQVWQNITQLA
ncbi:hypothetical protein [Nostoc sp. FACHB-145]|uniref:hypothetical protein n=1 Tax=Nostoc sp. FACHB-145 TaxID=2692836 RepID=UPI001686C70F|nr:hypothetical protein [Nostoc sp. FACHB-145]MBD2472415.1 hypothetical protein [Nostoc sp. FACHB-145]